MSNQDWKCKFCGSEKLMIPTGFVVSSKTKFGEHEPEMTFCCHAQRKNNEYIKKNYHPDDEPDPEEVPRW